MNNTAIIFTNKVDNVAVIENILRLIAVAVKAKKNNSDSEAIKERKELSKPIKIKGDYLFVCLLPESRQTRVVNLLMD